MKKVVLFLFLSTSGLWAQSLQPGGQASKEGVSEERLQRIDAMLQQAVQEKEIPGAVVLMARNGKVIYHKAFGQAAPNQAYRTDHIFRIASQTKAITSTALMMLWEEGKFRLDDPVSKYIPEFKSTGLLDTFNDKDSTFTTRSIPSPITIRQLLTHSAGIGYGILDDDRFRKIYQKKGIVDAFTDKPILLKDNIAKLAQMPLHFNPGEKYKYSEAIDVAGYLVEVLSGKSLKEFFEERIFQPLEMNDTYFYLPDNKQQRLAPVLTKENGAFKVLSHHDYYNPNYPIEGAKTYYSGGAGLSSTALDYAKFLQMYLNNGVYNGKRLLSRKTVEIILNDQLGGVWPGDKDVLGLAFSVINKKGAAAGGEGSEGTFSWGGYFNTQYFADPKENVIGIILKQTYNISSDNTSWKFKQLVFQTIND